MYAACTVVQTAPYQNSKMLRCIIATYQGHRIILTHLGSKYSKIIICFFGESILFFKQGNKFSLEGSNCAL